MALLASWTWQGLRHAPEPTARDGVEFSVVRGLEGAFRDVPVRIAWRRWAASGGTEASEGLPLVLIHGAPGGKEDWSRFAPLLAAGGSGAVARARDVYAVDLAGFGESTLRVPAHSIEAQAKLVRAWMDANGIARAHVLGWSNGGGVALHLAHDAPERIASVTLLASIGEQRYEGTGSHLLEHVRYGLGMLALGPAVDLLPHFGALGTRDSRTGWLRSFSESDQRPLTRVMNETRVATLIVHGEGDILVPVRSAMGAHAQIPGSRLVVLDANHFIPFMQAGQAAGVIGPFLAAADVPGGAGLAVNGAPEWLKEGSTTRLAPVLERSGLQQAAEPARAWVRDRSAWTLIAIIAACAFFAPALAAACATMFVLGSDMDYLVPILGVLVGLVVRDLVAAACARMTSAPGERLRQRLRLTAGSGADWAARLARAPFSEAWTACLMRDVRESSAGAAVLARATGWQRLIFVLGRALGHGVVATLTVMAALIVGAIVVGVLGDVAKGAFAREDLDPALLWAPMFAVLLLVARVAPLIISRRGRTRMYVAVRRAMHHEFWPSFWFYVPFWPGYVKLAIKHRGLLVWTCCNPGIGSGGGILGEDKAECFERFGVVDRAQGTGVFAPRDVAIWPYAVIQGGGTWEARGEAALSVLERAPDLGGLPIVMKPVSGLRGLGVRLARTPEQVREYFREVDAPVLLQRYHPGPLECSVLWVRKVTPGGDDGLVGEIYSITDKQFQTLEGDGTRTLEELIDRDRRARLQRDTFRSRHADRLAWIPTKGERVALNVAGNHCQGTIFRDGEHLRTPALERAIDRFCASYKDQGIDLVRLDVRYATPEDLQEGCGLSIVDVNGTMGESVNMYDPDRSYAWALRVMSGHWANMFAIGAWRRERGVTPLTLGQLWGLRSFYDRRRGSSVSD